LFAASTAVNGNLESSKVNQALVESVNDTRDLNSGLRSK